MSCYGIEDEVQQLKGRKVKSVAVVDWNQLVIEFTEGDPVRFGVEGDCCSSSWIISASLPHGGAELSGEWEDYEADSGLNEANYACLQEYGTHFKAAQGDGIRVVWVNKSNGYYGGYWVTA